MTDDDILKLAIVWPFTLAAVCAYLIAGYGTYLFTRGNRLVRGAAAALWPVYWALFGLALIVVTTLAGVFAGARRSTDPAAPPREPRPPAL